MKNSEALAQQVMSWCETLGAISQSSDYLDRRYLTPEHAKANQQTAQWMEDAGMDTWQDEVANVWGRLPSANPDAPRFIMGSHLDTVPNGGKYDGMLGVLTPIALVHALRDAQIDLPFHLDIVGFCDEEGTRFGSTLLGSRALTGTWQQDWAQLKDENGITLAEAMASFGLDFDRVAEASIADDENILGYFELHIEQGPVLEAQHLSVGVVSAIAGARRFQISVQGSAGHAGTVPMALRKDALAASAEMILAVERFAMDGDIVATVGSINNRPNGVNVIAGNTQFSLDIRSQDDQHRDEVLTTLFDEFSAIAKRRNVSVTHQQTHSAPSVACDRAMQQQLKQAMETENLTPFTLLSGAGHDAMAMAAICPVAMLFTRCYKGISHHPAEAINTQDVQDALVTLFRFITEYTPQGKTPQ